MSVRTMILMVTTDESLRVLCQALKEAEIIALDLETTGFDYLSDKIVGFGFSVNEGESYYVPVGHLGDDNQLPEEHVVGMLKPLLECDDKAYIAHNMKFDSRFLKAVGIHIPTKCVHDTLLEIFVAAEGFRELNLAYLVEEIFNVSLVEFEQLFPRGTKNVDKNIGLLPADLVGSYCGEQTDYTRRLHLRTYDKVAASFIYKLESELWPIVQKIEDTGFKADLEFLQKAEVFIREESAKVRELIYDQVSNVVGVRTEFNIASSTAMKKILFEDMGLPILTKTPKGQPSTGELALKALEDVSPVVKNILNYRSMESTATTMGKVLAGFVKEDGRIHTNYNQTGAGSGRFASSRPNMQNVAKRKSWTINRADGSLYSIVIYPRDALIAEEDYYLIELDYKAIEFIVMAKASGEDGIISAYERDIDLHKNTASLVLGKSIESITDDERNEAKTWNYLIIYGGSAYRLAKETGDSEIKSKADIERFHQTFPRLQQYSTITKDKARATKRVSTYFGRWAVVHEYNEPGLKSRAKADRVAVNITIQGTAADIQKMGLIRAYKKVDLDYGHEKIRMVAQTHDSQTWEVHRSIEPSDIIPGLSDAMSPDVPNYPRIKVDAKVGIAWGSVRDYDEDVDYKKLFMELDEQRKTYQFGIEEYGHDGPVGKSEIVGMVVDPKCITTTKQREEFTSMLQKCSGDLVVGFMYNGTITELPWRTSLAPSSIQSLMRSRWPSCEVSDWSQEIVNES